MEPCSCEQLASDLRLLILVPSAQADQSARTKCQIRLYRRTGDYLRCLMNADAAQAHGQNPSGSHRMPEACEKSKSPMFKSDGG